MAEYGPANLPLAEREAIQRANLMTQLEQKRALALDGVAAPAAVKRLIRRVVPAAGKMKKAPKRKKAAKKRLAKSVEVSSADKAKYTRFLNNQAMIRNAVLTGESLKKMGTFNPFRGMHLPPGQLKRDSSRIKGACFAYAQPRSDNNRQLASIYKKCIKHYDKTAAQELKSLPGVGRYLFKALTKGDNTFLRDDVQNRQAYASWGNRKNIGLQIRKDTAARKKALKEGKASKAWLAAKVAQ